jgi:hypothetical protein
MRIPVEFSDEIAAEYLDNIMAPMSSKDAWAKIIADGWNPGDEAIKAIMNKKDDLLDSENDVLSGLVQGKVSTIASRNSRAERVISKTTRSRRAIRTSATTC